MVSQFPGLDNYRMEKRVADIENSIQNSLLDNSETNSNTKIQPFYIAVTLLVLGCIGLIIYACVSLLM